MGKRGSSKGWEVGEMGEIFKKTKMLTILQSKKGLRQEGGNQSYEMNLLKLVILNMITFDYICGKAPLLVFFKN